jgi:plasmid maintenance system killer protein
MLFASSKGITLNALRYIIIRMIRSFKCKETEKIFSRQVSRKLPRDIQQVALRKLRMLNRAVTLQDLRVPPANRLKSYGETEQDNIVFVSMINGAFALSGAKGMLTTWKSRTIIRRIE